MNEHFMSIKIDEYSKVYASDEGEFIKLQTYDNIGEAIETKRVVYIPKNIIPEFCGWLKERKHFSKKSIWKDERENENSF